MLKLFERRKVSNKERAERAIALMNQAIDEINEIDWKAIDPPARALNITSTRDKLRDSIWNLSNLDN